MPNAFAFFVLFSYPIVVMVLFRRLPVPTALIWSILMGYLFLPESTEIDLPLLPAIDKTLVPSLVAGLMCWITPSPMQTQDSPAKRVSTQRRRALTTRGSPDSNTKFNQTIRQSWAANGFIAILLIAPFGVVLTNADWVVVGPRIIPGLRIYDAFSMILDTGVMILPFLLARKHLTTQQAHLQLLRAFVGAALVYSLFILIEVRLSPQFHRWIYGFHAHSFAQQIRNDGFRPMVFIQHGLRVGLFVLLAVVAALTLFKIRAEARNASGKLRNSGASPAVDKGLPIQIMLYLLVILFLCKTLGTLMIAAVVVPFLLLAGPQKWRFLAVIFAVLVLLYPMARSAGVVPVDLVYDFALSVNADRAQSFGFRLFNEEMLLDRAAQKPLWGWGGWGRSLIYDPSNGNLMSTTDGTWVIVFGVSGWLGYVATFGLLTSPIFAYLVVRGPLRTSIASQGLCILLAINLVDLIPNSGLTPVTWMVAGALLGRFERREQEEPSTSPQHRSASVEPRRVIS